MLAMILVGLSLIAAADEGGSSSPTDRSAYETAKVQAGHDVQGPRPPGLVVRVPRHVGRADETSGDGRALRSLQ